MAIEHPMTPDQVRDNYEFKVTKRILMREFPWIKDVTIDEGDLQVYNTIFVNLIIDPIELANQYNWVLNRWVKGNNYESSTPSMLFDITHKEGEEKVSDPIDKILNEVHTSKAIPQELKLPDTRWIGIGGYIIP